MAIDLHQLRCLAALNRLGRVQPVADALGMTVAEVNAGLNRLQAELGVVLLARHHRFTGLTAQGRRFAAIAEVVAELVSAGALHVGASAEICKSLALPCAKPEPPAQRVSRRRARAGAVVAPRFAAGVAFSRAAE